MKVFLQPELIQLFPKLTLGVIWANVSVAASESALQHEMQLTCDSLLPYLTLESIRKHPVIEMTKRAYRNLGKDPNRYRPAAESLLRRLCLGKGLYNVNNVVDVLNLVSIKTGFSIGGYDRDIIQGPISFGVGQAGEAYTGIGRGALNIENLPVFRDKLGAFGTPTSDSVRTMITKKTQNLLMVIPAFDGMEKQFVVALELVEQLLIEFCGVKQLKVVWQGHYSVSRK